MICRVGICTYITSSMHGSKCFQYGNSSYQTSIYCLPTLLATFPSAWKRKSGTFKARKDRLWGSPKFHGLCLPLALKAAGLTYWSVFSQFFGWRLLLSAEYLCVYGRLDLCSTDEYFKAGYLWKNCDSKNCEWKKLARRIASLQETWFVVMAQ